MNENDEQLNCLASFNVFKLSSQRENEARDPRQKSEEKK